MRTVSAPYLLILDMRTDETVGEVTCAACRALVVSFYGDPVRHLYERLDAEARNQ